MCYAIYIQWNVNCCIVNNGSQQKQGKHCPKEGIECNNYKIASLLVWVTSFGTGFFGSNGLKEKAKKAFNCKCEFTLGAENGEIGKPF